VHHTVTTLVVHNTVTTLVVHHTVTTLVELRKGCLNTDQKMLHIESPAGLKSVVIGRRIV
jgi:hypothetical protein